ncbi:hypothetical protein PsaNZ64_00310 [Pseudomonas syringae pv. actinidiae]|nr:hypothetical protein PsaNZ64_00310 [Pseudomonas syringae pv. actinidiae]
MGGAKGRQVHRFHGEIRKCQPGAGFVLVIQLGKHRAGVESVNIAKLLQPFPLRGVPYKQTANTYQPLSSPSKQAWCAPQRGLDHLFVPFVELLQECLPGHALGDVRMDQPYGPPGGLDLDSQG